MLLQLIKLRVLVVTVKGLGVETAKNLVLAGPAAVTVHDEGLVEAKDLGANFFLRESDIGRRRGDAVVAQLRALNEDVDLKTTRAFARAQGACSLVEGTVSMEKPSAASFPFAFSQFQPSSPTRVHPNPLQPATRRRASDCRHFV